LLHLFCWWAKPSQGETHCCHNRPVF